MNEEQGRRISLGKMEGQRFEMYASARRHMEELWDLVSKPIKFPAPRRRRDDHKLPKAA